MKDLLNTLERVYEKPEPIDFTEAEGILRNLAGQKYTNLGETMEIVTSQNPQVFASQLKCMAYHCFYKRKRLEKEAQGLIPVGVLAPVKATTPPISDYEQNIANQRRKSSLLLGSNSIYSNVALDAPETKPTAAIRWLRDVFIPSGKQEAVLIGGTGSGKTYSAIAFCSKFSQETQPNHLNAYFVDAMKLAKMLQGRDEQDHRKLETTSILVIDDFGTLGAELFRAKEFQATFEALFNHRHSQKRKTLITSNLSPEALKTALGDRVMSRITENGLIFMTNDGDLRKV